MDYSKGKIYKIVCNVTGLQYFGSTVSTLADRKYNHKADYKKWKEGNKDKGYIRSFQVLENDDWDIVLVEKYPCQDTYELKARERFHIENNECVNKNIPTRTMKEYIKDNRRKIYDANNAWRERNKDKVNERKKEYYKQNKAMILEKARLKYAESKKK